MRLDSRRRGNDVVVDHRFDDFLSKPDTTTWLRRVYGSPAWLPTALSTKIVNCLQALPGVRVRFPIGASELTAGA
jgi:hypothetical protein